MLTTAATEQLDDLLDRLAESLDVPPAVDREFIAKYSNLGQWIRQDCEERHRSDSEIYPQGSRCLGTMNAPARRGQDCDFDVVYRRDLVKMGVTQEELKHQVGDQLARYVAYLRSEGEEVPQLEERARCWTLRWGDRFHMDILPAIPDDDTSMLSYGGEQILITDRDLRNWQSSNPKGYAAWFAAHSKVSAGAADMVAPDARVDIVPVPEHGRKSLLQRRVQLLKRHRDLFYDGDPDDRPSSIIVTTLATRADEPGMGLYQGLVLTASRMAGLVQRRDGVWWVPNPINAKENFADRWVAHPQRADRFFEWVAKLESDLYAAGARPGLAQVTASLSTSFGRDAAEEAARRVGTALQATRDAGRLRAAAGTGTLGTSGAIQVARHTFFGGRR